MTWQIELNPTDAQVRSYLLQHRVWSAYALNDLRPPFRERSQFVLAVQGAEWALILIYRTSTFTAFIPFGPAAGVRALLKALDDLPKSCIISNGVGDYRPMLDEWYTIGPEELMYRMVVTPEAFKPFDSFVASEQLGIEHVPEMTGFYAMNNVATFSPDQVQHGMYFGIRRHGILVAVCGTHFVDAEDHVAALGNVFTDPALRGNGYIRSMVNGLVKTLFEYGCREVVVNVEKHNFGAMQAYESLGFTTHAMFWEAHAKRKNGEHRS